ncbi:SDR family NAD(P)-dependent oxidoreductase [Jiella marina]|uniref:SDR family NAD(P)-dependent oxidoreductase n=1 Tax=Jiella sp. LLJ827 TaxID=2917712 RepID=UPI002101C35B|nr:SDR family NAD(P)-dependent oxidoreductase [Jiella sp. LLJ827]MCQ0990363.1 SDR family NAD(P)-dependent oxidoreductase [Jiella sp. LLJ827]
MTQIAGRTALITGGASGIGLLMGRMLMERGAARLFVWDVSATNIDLARVTLDPLGTVVFDRVDVSDTEAVRAAVARLEADGTAIDLLINNAGIVVGKPFLKHGHADIDRTLAINTGALMHLTRALLPGMVSRGRGHVVNIASAAALVSNPNMSVYAASKWAVTGWSDSLRQELERSGTGVRVTTVLPYYIHTGMFDGVRSRLIPILQPEDVARRILRAVQRDAVFLHMPAIVRLLPLLRGLLPTRALDFVLNRIFGVASSMDDFHGRQETAKDVREPKGDLS